MVVRALGGHDTADRHPVTKTAPEGGVAGRLHGSLAKDRPRAVSHLSTRADDVDTGMGMGDPEERHGRRVVVGGWWLVRRRLIGRLLWFPDLGVVATRLGEGGRGAKGRVQYTARMLINSACFAVMNDRWLMPVVAGEQVTWASWNRCSLEMCRGR